MNIPLSLLLIFLATLQSTAYAADIAREKSWADQIVDIIVVGEPVWLEARKIKFLALYAPPSKPEAGKIHGIILLHGRGVHPAWGFIENLRVDFSELGWHTLSLQMPLLKADAKLIDYQDTFPEAFDRIEAGIKFMKSKGVSSVTIMGHSSGAMTAISYAAERPSSAVTRLIGIGSSTLLDASPHMQPALSLTKIRIPVLDIYGQNDIPEVLNFTQARADAAKQAGNRAYSQVSVRNANHFYTDRYEELKSVIYNWLKH